MRPLHFSAAGEPGRMEPVALVHFRGVYRLFYESAGEADSGKVNGGSDPGKAKGVVQSTSKDLIDWSKGAVFTFPQYNGSGFHGGIVIDSNNLTGYGSREK